MPKEQKIQEIIEKMPPTNQKFIGMYGDIMARLENPKGKIDLKKMDLKKQRKV